MTTCAGLGLRPKLERKCKALLWPRSRQGETNIWNKKPRCSVMSCGIYDFAWEKQHEAGIFFDAGFSSDVLAPLSMLSCKLKCKGEIWSRHSWVSYEYLVTQVPTRGFLPRQANWGILWTRSWPLSGFEVFLKHQRKVASSILNHFGKGCWLDHHASDWRQNHCIWQRCKAFEYFYSWSNSGWQSGYLSFRGFRATRLVESESPLPFSSDLFGILDFPAFYRSSKWKHRECFWMLVPPRRVFCVL